MHLPTDAQERKKTPLFSGVVKYFPDALVAVAQLSQKGNDQHNPGQPLHWSREKSSDHEDTLMRHLFDSGETDVDGIPHCVKVAWRALAIAQLYLEKQKAKNEEPKPKVSEGPKRPGIIHHYPGGCSIYESKPFRYDPRRDHPGNLNS